MKNNLKVFCCLLSLIIVSSCVSKKEYLALDAKYTKCNSDFEKCQSKLEKCNAKLTAEENKVVVLNTQLAEEKIKYEKQKGAHNEVLGALKEQVNDLRKQRDQQFTQVGDLTVLSKSASQNMNNTLKQLEKKDDYIKYLLNAKSKADSLNLALSINLKSVLKKGIEDEDIDVKVDKTVVFINLSDKMLFESGSHKLTTRAYEVLAKIAEIIKSRPEMELMVEGYTDNVPISTNCIEDNWDLSVKRSASVVRTLEDQFDVDPNKLIAAGRGEYNSLADNTTSEGRSLNRRTRIIILPKLNQFYDLLKPSEQ